MADEHAQLSPSASARWLSCPASVRMEERVSKPSESFYAYEGTLAHELAELELSHALGKIDDETLKRRYDEWVAEVTRWSQTSGLDRYDLVDMKRHIGDLVALVRHKLEEEPNSTVLLESRVYPGIEGCYGTADIIIVSGSHIEVIDLKYGQGVRVSAKDNSQLRLYGLGALELVDGLLGDIKTVTTTIVQPRLNSLSSETLTARELRAWRGKIRPIAVEALEGSDRFGPSPSACQFCPAAGECRARMEYMAQSDFGGDPDLLSPEEIGELIDRIPDIQRWCSSVQEAALRMVFSEGKTIPGKKVVLSNGRRSIKDEVGAIQTLIDHGYTAEQVAALRIKTIGDLEKLVGAKELARVLDKFFVKTVGKPALVPEDDDRPAVNPESEAAKDFQ